MVSRSILHVAKLLVFGLVGISPVVQANDGVAHVQGNYGPVNSGQYYLMMGNRAERQAPNPTYWTRLSCPMHGQCNYCGNPSCPGDHGCWTIPAVRWMLDPNYYTVAPDYGWSPPGKWPIHRTAPVYQRYYPDQWYGTGKSASRPAQAYPVVGQPTDTTQMGYYYQTVPQWQPNPGMLPAAPHPSMWHKRQYELGPDGVGTRWVPIANAWVPLYQIPGAGYEVQSRPAQPGNYQRPQPVEAQQQQPVEAQPVPPQPAPPAPPPPPAPQADAAGDDVTAIQ